MTMTMSMMRRWRRIMTQAALQHLLGRLQQGVCLGDHALECGSGSEVSGPVGVRVRGVGQEVVFLAAPALARSQRGIVHGFQVARGGRVKDVQPKRLVAVDVLLELVHVLEPHVGVHVVEVFSWVIKSIAGHDLKASPMVMMTLLVV